MQFGGQTPLSLAKPLQDALEKNPIMAASGAFWFCLVVLETRAMLRAANAEHISR